MKDRKLVVVKSNKVIEASYRLSLSEQRIILACIGKMDSTEAYTNQDEFEN